MERHPKAELLASFVEGRLQPSQARAVMAHLIHGCAECTAEAQRFFRPPRNLADDFYDTAFDRAYARVQEHLPEDGGTPRPVQPDLAVRMRTTVKGRAHAVRAPSRASGSRCLDG